jgi:hypothetical protein
MVMRIYIFSFPFAVDFLKQRAVVGRSGNFVLSFPLFFLALGFSPDLHCIVSNFNSMM